MGTTIKETKYCFQFFVQKNLELTNDLHFKFNLGLIQSFLKISIPNPFPDLAFSTYCWCLSLLLCSSLFILSISSFFFHLKFCHWFSFLLPQNSYVPLSFYCKLLVHFVASHSSFFCAIWKDLCFYRRKFMALFSFVASHWLFFCKLQLFIKRISGWKVWSAIIVLW